MIKSRNILQDLKEIKVIEFDHHDVVRHPLVSKIIKAYQNKSVDDKINVITNNNNWFNYLKKPNDYVHRKIVKLNLKEKNLKEIKFFVLYYSLAIKKLKTLIENLEKNKATDILSFPFQTKKEFKKKLKLKKEIYLGDIIINLNKIKSKNVKKNFKLQFDNLWIHGLVHLFGYDHKSENDFKIMRRMEKKYLHFVNG